MHYQRKDLSQKEKEKHHFDMQVILGQVEKKNLTSGALWQTFLE